MVERINATDVGELPPIELLPTSPLYKLQQLRDRVIERLLVIPDVKLEYLLSMSDKKLHEYVILQSQGQNEKAMRSASEGSHYLTKFVGYLSLSQEYFSAPVRIRQFCSFFEVAKRQRRLLISFKDIDQNIHTLTFIDSMLSFLSMHEERAHSLYGEPLDCTTITVY